MVAEVLVLQGLCACRPGSRSGGVDHSGATHEAQVSEVPAKAWSQGAVLGVHSFGGARVLLSAGEAGRVL